MVSLLSPLKGTHCSSQTKTKHQTGKSIQFKTEMKKELEMKNSVPEPKGRLSGEWWRRMVRGEISFCVRSCPWWFTHFFPTEAQAMGLPVWLREDHIHFCRWDWGTEGLGDPISGKVGLNRHLGVCCFIVAVLHCRNVGSSLGRSINQKLPCPC